MESTLPDVHDPNAVLSYLQSPLRAIWDAIDHGIQVGDSIRDEFFDGTHDSHYWSHSVRRGARHKMEQWQQAADWSLIGKPPLSAIHVRHGEAAIRVLKGTAGGGPPAPKSGRSKKFCRQLSLDVGIPGGSNFLVDWDTDDQREPVIGLSLPKAAWFFIKKPELEWWCKVALQGEVMTFVGSVEKGVLVASVLDLPDIKASGEKL